VNWALSQVNRDPTPNVATEPAAWRGHTGGRFRISHFAPDLRHFLWWAFFHGSKPVQL
jgi:hypothetical protein